MSLTLRSTKGSPLTNAEGDANFSGLADGSLLTGIQASSGSSLVGTIAAGAGAVARTVQAKERDIVSVKDFGAVGDGVTDDTVAIQAAHDSLPAAGGALKFPAGTYLVTAAITFSKKTSLCGDGPQSTTITTNHATADIFEFTSAGALVSGLNFTSSVTRTAGAFVEFSSVQAHITDFFMTSYYIGIEMSGPATIRASHGSIRSGSATAGGAGILINPAAGGNDYYVESITMDAPVGSQPSAGIQITNSGATQIWNCDIIHHQANLLLNPGNGQGVSATYVVDSFFDSATYGIKILPSGTGAVNNARFMGCWTGNQTQQGVLIQNAGTGSIDGIEFIGHHSFLNASGGFLVQNGNTLPINVRILGGAFAQNTGNGIAFAAGIKEFSIIGARIGAGYGFTGNTSAGILVDVGASDNYVIQSNDLRGNGTVGLNDNGTGISKYIIGNMGYAPPPITVISTPHTVGGDNEYIYNIASAASVTLPTASSFGGRELYIRSVFSAVNSASSNVVPLGGGAAGTAILSGGTKWARLKSDGSNWTIMASN